MVRYTVLQPDKHYTHPNTPSKHSPAAMSASRRRTDHCQQNKAEKLEKNDYRSNDGPTEGPIDLAAYTAASSRLETRLYTRNCRPYRRDLNCI